MFFVCVFDRITNVTKYNNKNKIVCVIGGLDPAQEPCRSCAKNAYHLRSSPSNFQPWGKCTC